MAEVASAFVSLIPSAKGFGAAISKEIGGDLSKAGAAGGEKYAGGMKSKLGSMGKSLFAPLAAAAGGLALGSFFNSAADSASDFNETVNKTDVIFGNNASTIKKWSSTAATSLGLSQEQALNAASGFGDMFTQIGFTGDSAAKMSTSVVQAAADLGSFSNLDTADVADRMSAAFRGEYDSLQAVIPNINAARVEQEAMAATGKKTTKALTAQDKAAAVLAIVHKDGARAMGDFARTSDGVANKSKIVAAQAADMKRKFGALILPLKALAIDAFGALLTMIPKVAAGLQRFGGFISEHSTAFKIAAGIITAVFLPALIAMGVQATISAAKSVAGWIASGAAAVKGAVMQSGAVIKTVAGWVLMGVQSLIQAGRMAAAWLIAMGPIGWAIAAVVAVAALVIANWDKIKKWTTKAWSAIGKAVGKAWDTIKEWVSRGFDFVKRLFLNFTGPGLVIKHWGKITSTISGAWEAIKRFVSAGIDRVKGYINGLGSIVGRVRDFFGRAKDAAVDKLTSLVSWVQGIPGRIVSALGNVGGILLNAGRSIIQGLLDGITEKFGAVQDMLSSLTDKLPDWKGPASRDKVILRDAGQLVIGGFIDGMESQFSNAQASLNGLTRALPGSPHSMSLGGPGGRAGRDITIQNLEVKALGDRFDLNQTMESLSWRMGA